MGVYGMVARANTVASLVHEAVLLEQVLPTQLHGLVNQLVGLQRAGSDGGAVLACPAASMNSTVRAAPRRGSGSERRQESENMLPPEVAATTR